MTPMPNMLLVVFGLIIALFGTSLTAAYYRDRYRLSRSDRDMRTYAKAFATQFIVLLLLLAATAVSAVNTFHMIFNGVDPTKPLAPVVRSAQ